MPTTDEPSSSSDEEGHLQILLQEIQQAIWDRRPILGEIMKKKGGKILHTYARDFLDVNPAPMLDARQDELVVVAEELLRARLGAEVARGAAEQLQKLPLVSTADHHGPIDHPFWVNANIISALPIVERQDALMRYLVVFSFASVSVNNASAYPRGILFHGGVKGVGKSLRLPILPDKVKMGVVYGMRPYTREELQKAEQQLAVKVAAGEVDEDRSREIVQLLEKYFAMPEVLAAPDLASQISIINYHLWPKLFRPAAGQTDATNGVRIPDLIYLEIETLVTQLILRRHLDDARSSLYEAMFGRGRDGLVHQLFNNLAGGFSLEKDWGTYLFWALDDKNHRVQLKLDPDGKLLASPERTIVVPLTPAGIREALEKKQIFPSMLLAYLTIALYYGMKCLGGFCQVHDLTVIKEAWAKFLESTGRAEEAQSLATVQTKELGGDGMVLSYVKTAGGGVDPATGIDLALGDVDSRYDNYLQFSKTISLAEMMYPMLPEMYSVLYSIHQRDPRLTTLTPAQIMQYIGLEKKVLSQLPGLA